MVRLARSFAGTTQPIFLRGEVGSGKSLFAQSIHNASPCSKGPFVTFDCGAGWQNQWESLSRAAKDADTGTLYLDHLKYLGSGRPACTLPPDSGERGPSPGGAGTSAGVGAGDCLHLRHGAAPDE